MSDELDPQRKKTSGVPNQTETETASLPEGAARLDASLIQRAREHRDLLTASDVMRLQRTVGNRAVQKILGRERGQVAPTPPVPTPPVHTPPVQAPSIPSVRSTPLIQRKPNKLKSLDTYLKHKEYIPRFKEYTAQAQVMESYDFLLAVRRFRKHPTVQEADNIMSRYVQRGAPQEINITEETLGLVQDELAQAKSDIAGMRHTRHREQRLRSVFDAAYKHIHHMMERDTMKSHFFNSQAFQDLRSIKSSWFGRKLSHRKAGKETMKESSGAYQPGYMTQYGMAEPGDMGAFGFLTDF